MKQKEFWERIKKERLVARARFSVRDYPLYGDSGFPECSIYYSKEKGCYVMEEPTERSNNVYSIEFESEDEAFDFVYHKIKGLAEWNER